MPLVRNTETGNNFLEKINTDGDACGSAAVRNYQKFVIEAPDDKKQIALNFLYVPGSHTLFVYVNGQKAEFLDPTIATPAELAAAAAEQLLQYNESGNQDITFYYDLVVGDVVECVIVGAYTGEVNDNLVQDLSDYKTVHDNIPESTHFTTDQAMGGKGFTGMRAGAANGESVRFQQLGQYTSGNPDYIHYHVELKKASDGSTVVSTADGNVIVTGPTATASLDFLTQNPTINLLDSAPTNAAQSQIINNDNKLTINSRLNSSAAWGSVLTLDLSTKLATFSGNVQIQNTAPRLTFTDTTTNAKGAYLQVNNNDLTIHNSDNVLFATFYLDHAELLARFAGNVEIYNSRPRLRFMDTDNNDFSIDLNDGFLSFFPNSSYDNSNGFFTFQKTGVDGADTDGLLQIRNRIPRLWGTNENGDDIWNEPYKAYEHGFQMTNKAYVDGVKSVTHQANLQIFASGYKQVIGNPYGAVSSYGTCGYRYFPDGTYMVFFTIEIESDKVVRTFNPFNRWNNATLNSWVDGGGNPIGGTGARPVGLPTIPEPDVYPFSAAYTIAYNGVTYPHGSTLEDWQFSMVRNCHYDSNPQSIGLVGVYSTELLGGASIPNSGIIGLNYTMWYEWNPFN